MQYIVSFLTVRLLVMKLCISALMVFVLRDGCGTISYAISCSSTNRAEFGPVASS